MGQWSTLLIKLFLHVPNKRAPGTPESSVKTPVWRQTSTFHSQLNTLRTDNKEMQVFRVTPRRRHNNKAKFLSSLLGTCIYWGTETRAPLSYICHTTTKLGNIVSLLFLPHVRFKRTCPQSFTSKDMRPRFHCQQCRSCDCTY
jgi:hypothetical protein